jgi:competence protein ComGF
MDPFIASVIIGGIAACPGLYAVLRQRQKDLHSQSTDDYAASIQASRNAADTVNTYSIELRKVRDELDKMRIDFDALKEKDWQKDQLIADWQDGIERLIGQIVSLGHVPVWRPKARVDK